MKKLYAAIMALALTTACSSNLRTLPDNPRSAHMNSTYSGGQTLEIDVFNAMPLRTSATVPFDLLPVQIQPHSKCNPVYPFSPPFQNIGPQRSKMFAGSLTGGTCNSVWINLNPSYMGTNCTLEIDWSPSTGYTYKWENKGSYTTCILDVEGQIIYISYAFSYGGPK